MIGSGWTTVVSVRQPADGAALPASLGTLVGQVTTPVTGAFGSGRLLTTRLFTVLLTDDGRLLAGAVTRDRLLADAAGPAARS